VTELLRKSFYALGADASPREIKLVADTLRASGDTPTLRVLEAAADDLRAFEALCRVADEAGAYGFVALDLVMAYRNPRGVRHA
jgi:hypothetical protein